MAMLLVAVALGATTLTATAQDPILACQNVFTGQIRIIQPFQNCNANEIFLEFASQAQIDDLQDQIDALDVRVSDLEDRMDDAEDRLDDHETRIIDLENRVGALEVQVALNVTAILNLQIDLGNLQALVNTVINTLNQLIGVVDDITNCIQTFTIDIGIVTFTFVEPFGTIICLTNLILPGIIVLP